MNRRPKHRGWTLLHRGIGACLAALAVAGAARAQEDAQEVFDSLFAEDLKRVAATRETDDDLRLAEQLVAAAETTTGQPELLAILCEKAHELAARNPAGQETAFQAMKLLATHCPEKQADANGKLLAAARARCEAATGPERAEAAQDLLALLEPAIEAHVKTGDYRGAADLCKEAWQLAIAVSDFRAAVLEARLKRLTDLDKTAIQVARIRTQLDSSPNNRIARERAITLCVVDLDNPDLAATFLDESVDETLRKYVPAAAKGIDSAPELACMELAEWYEGLADTPSPTTKAALLQRAMAYYERYLELHPGPDLLATKARLAADKIQAQLDRLGDTAAAGSGWVDLLKLIDPARNAVRGAWVRQSTGLAIPSADWSIIEAPVALTGSYDLEIDFTSSVPGGYVIVMFPVGIRSAPLVLQVPTATGPGYARLEGVAGAHVDLAPAALPDKQRLQVRVMLKGTDVEVAARLDGRTVLQWRGPKTHVTGGTIWRPRTHESPALGAHATNVLFSAFRLRMLAGEASLIPQRGTFKKPKRMKPMRRAE